jgi:NAD(P)-dependent dehydrogenase (short-subunit alcohol dehydrogenase family)
MRLKGRVSVITGSGAGQGRAAALLFAREGARVVVAELKEEDGQDTVDQVKKEGGEAAYVHVDVSKSQDVQNMVKFAVDRYERLDILYNNAGVSGRPYGDAGMTAEIPEEGWDSVVDLNLKSVFLGCKYGIPELIKSGGGCIINTSSGTYITGGFLPGMFNSKMSLPVPNAYAAAKAGVVALSRAVAVAYARQKIRCNVICPGMTDTAFLAPLQLHEKGKRQALEELIPMGRLGRAEDMAYAALYLASDESSYVTGTILTVDGGLLAI